MWLVLQLMASDDARNDD